MNELARKVELTWEWNRSKPRIEVYTVDGRILVGEEEVVNREPFTPTPRKMAERFMAFASNYLGAEKAVNIVEMVKNLEAVEDLRRLTTMLLIRYCRTTNRFCRVKETMEAEHGHIRKRYRIRTH